MEPYEMSSKKNVPPVPSSPALPTTTSPAQANRERLKAFNLQQWTDGLVSRALKRLQGHSKT
jgi:hypothetical protein